MAKPALGRGLGALLGSSRPPAATPGAGLSSDAAGEVRRVPIERIQPCAFQPRKDFSDDSLRELADSIRAQGVVQPLIVRARGSDFELIAGERRWRAAQLAGLKELPIIVREADDRAVLELALIENLQRENLNAIEEAMGYFQLTGQFGLTQEDAAQRVGKSRAVVANALRLLKLSPELQAHIRNGRLSVGHGKVILGLNEPQEQALAAERVLKNGLNVRQAEELVAAMQKSSSSSTGARGAGKTVLLRDAHVTDLEQKLQERFGTKVHLRYRQGKGAVEIKFFNDDDLERVLKIAGVTPD